MAFPNSSTEMPPFDKMIDAFIAMARELAESPEFAPVLQRVGLHDQLEIPELYAIDESIIETAPSFLATAGMYRMCMVPALARRFATKAIDPADSTLVQNYVVPRIRPKPTIDPFGTKVTGPSVKASEILRMLHNLYRARPEYIEMFEELRRDVVNGVIPLEYLQATANEQRTRLNPGLFFYHQCDHYVMDNRPWAGSITFLLPTPFDYYVYGLIDSLDFTTVGTKLLSIVSAYCEADVASDAVRDW